MFDSTMKIGQLLQRSDVFGVPRVDGNRFRVLDRFHLRQFQDFFTA